MSLGETIYIKRKEKGLTQEELAEKINVARQTVSKWETGDTLPDVESLKNLALVLEFSIDEILGIETDGNDDKTEWLIIGGFIVGNSLGLIFDNMILGYAAGMAGLGAGFLMKAFRK